LPNLRIVIAGDHELFRARLRKVLEARPDWTVIGEARTGRQVVELVERLDPDVAIVDFNMPEMNGLEATRAITMGRSRCEVLMLTLHDSEERVREILRAGAHGYVLKSDAARDVVRAVDAVSHHASFFISKAAPMVMNGYVTSARTSGNRASLDRFGGPPQPNASLTRREREVAQLVAEGKSNKEIARILGISVKTTETHRASAMHKLGLESVSDLVRWAVRNHLIEI